MINLAARQRLMEDKKTQTLVNGMKEAVVTAVKGVTQKKDDSEALNQLKSSIDSKLEVNSKQTQNMIDDLKNTIGKLGRTDEVNNVSKMSLEDVFKRLVVEEGNKKLLEKLVAISESSTKTTSVLDKIGEALAMMYKAVSKPLLLPKIFQVKGQVDVGSMPSVKITNLNEMGAYFASLEEKIRTWAQASALAPQPKIEIPKIEIPESKIDTSGIIEAISGLKDSLGKKSPDESIGVLRKIRDDMERLANRPQLTPQPVTNININGLQGFAKTTAATVTTALTQLPAYGELNNRRTLIIYNNGSNTVYIGGSDVTSSNGLPVTASSYSPAIDAGVNMKIYGVTDSGSSDCRILEVSSNQTSSKVQ